MTNAIITTHLQGFAPPRRGKVRDIYDLGEELLIITTDRISCFDVVLPTPIPGKGEILARMARFWFGRMSSIINNHLSDRPVAEVLPSDILQQLGERATIVKKAKVLPVEAIVRGYLSGTGWKEYCKTGTVCGIALPKHLQESEQLPEPIFTPSTKADQGEHDQNISFAQMENIIGSELAHQVRNAALSIYRNAAAYARERGIIIADTKFEFGLLNDKLIIVDEALTPDSSRFWPLVGYQPGCAQPSFDKQFVRDYLETLDWDKTAPGPKLPEHIVSQTKDKYAEAARLLMGAS